MKPKLPLSAYQPRRGEDEFDAICRTGSYAPGIFVFWVAMVRGFRWLRHPRQLPPWTSWRADLWVVTKIVVVGLLFLFANKLLRH